MSHNGNKRTQAGDTIVEVLIALAIISLVLVGAFVVSSRSTNAVQDSAEHDQAQQYLQQEVETLRSWLADPAHTQDLTTLSGPFCLTSASDGTASIINAAHLQPLDTSQADIAHCVPSGATSVKFVPYITYDSTNNDYDCRVIWEGINSSAGDSLNEVEFFYKDYPVVS